VVEVLGMLSTVEPGGDLGRSKRTRHPTVK
jgi:hypothetical protein